MQCRIGDFVVKGSPIVSISSADAKTIERIQGQIDAAFALNRTRTVEQDVAFGIRQIVDVALRALSPSLSDPTTGVMCVDHLADLLAHIAARHVESPYRRKEGALRVVATRPDFSELVALAFDQIRVAARNDSTLLKRILWALEIISTRTSAPARLEALARCANDVERTATRHLEEEEERERVSQSARTLARRLSLLAGGRSS